MFIFEYGFILWGVFAIYAVVIAAYLIWMVATEKKNPDEQQKGGSQK